MDEQFKQQFRELAKEVICFKFTDDMTLKEVKENLYNIMRKYNIKWGEQTDSGITAANFEWTFIREMYLKRMYDYVDFSDLFAGIPKDLEV